MGKKYDVLICLFSSIGYVITQDNLKKTIGCFKRHLNNEGVMFIEPWITPENWQPGHPHMTTVSEEDLKVCRMNISETRNNNQSYLKFHYLVGTSKGISHFTEEHVLGLFSVSEMKSAFIENSLKVQFDEEGIFGRGLYLAELA